MAIRRGGFTLVEMLVVIAIIALLMTLLFPAISGIRERAKQVMCVDNLHNYGEALIMYEGQRGYLPGYRNIMPIFTNTGVATGNNLVVGWQVLLLPNIQKSDVYKQWTDYCNPQAGGPVPSLPVPTAIEISVCPSSAKLDRTQPNTTYVANCGHCDGLTTGIYTGIDTRDTAVFHDMSLNPTTNSVVKQTLDFIGRSDGTSNTMMLTENLDTTFWNPTSQTPVNGYSTTPTLPGPADELLLGVVYDPYYTSSPTNANSPYKINFNKGISHTPAQNIQYARPSSNHPAGVVMLFCDGAAKFVREDIGSSVPTANGGPWTPQVMLGYLMTPNGRKGKSNGTLINEPIIPAGTF